MHAVGLFDAKTHFSEYVARAEAGEEVIIMRHNKPVAKIVPLNAKPIAVDIPKYVQRVFHTGDFLVDVTKANQIAGELDNIEFLKLNARLEREANRRKKTTDKKSKTSKPHEIA
jgi:prevent-host-death family protein